MTSRAHPWAAIVPVKRLEFAKTRLSLPAGLRAELALAMALDSVAAALSATLVDVVVVVTDDVVAAAAMKEIGAEVVGDAPDAGLNPALRHGASSATASRDVGGVVALSSDLPALSADALDVVLMQVARLEMPRLQMSGGTTAFVADAVGNGTSLLAASPSSAFDPRFGPDSARRHSAAGAVDVTAAADARVRRDVDTLDDLAAAVALGCGPATTALLGRHPELDWPRF